MQHEKRYDCKAQSFSVPQLKSHLYQLYGATRGEWLARLLNNNRIQRRNSRVVFACLLLLLFCIFTISLLRREPSPTTYTQVARAQSCANHVQHIERSPRATCHVTCHVVRKDSSAVKYDKVEIAYILALFYCLKPLTDEKEEETGIPGENPWQRASENATY